MEYGSYDFSIESQSRIYSLFKLVAGVNKFTVLDKIQAAWISFKEVLGFQLDKHEIAKIVAYETVNEMREAATQCFKIWDKVIPSPQRDALLSKSLETLEAGFNNLQCSSAAIIAPRMVYEKTAQQFIAELQGYNQLSS